MPDTEKPSLPVGFLQAWFMQLDSNSRPTINSARRRMFLLFIGVLILAGVNLYLACVPSSSLALFLGKFDILFSLLMMLMILILFRMVWSQLLDPLVKLNNWADEMRAVNLDARVVFQPGSDFRELGNDINMLANMIEQLSSDTEAQLQKYTDHISRESKSLAILYDVASNINISRDLNELFDKSLQSICLNLNASAGIIRQFKAKGRQHVVASFGDLNHTFLASIDQFLPIEGGNLFGNESGIAQTDGLDRSTIFATKENDLQKSVITLSVMVKYREEALGAIHLFFNDSDEQNFLDFHELLLSIGQHLGTAVEKFRLLEDESQLLIMQERTRLSDELHDSLAQTIASLRIQLRVVGEMTRANDQDGSAHQLSRIEFTIDQANDQLRELIAHFRIPLNKQGFISAIEESINQLKADTGISIYFQNEWPEQDMSADAELNVVRIVQECLANVRKHSQAKSVRISLTIREQQNSLLCEDDGIGFDESKLVSAHGRHLGLNILRNRAKQLNGSIEIESEPGEGTRIQVQFKLPNSYE